MPALESVVGDKEVLDCAQHFRRDGAQLVNPGGIYRAIVYRDQAIVSDDFTVLALRSADDTDQPYRQKTTWKQIPPAAPDSPERRPAPNRTYIYCGCQPACR